jgi:hypothetical protein
VRRVKEGEEKERLVRVEEDERRSKSPDSPGLRKVGWMDGKMERWGWGMGDDAVLNWTGPMRVGIAGAERVCSECAGRLVWRWAWRTSGPGQLGRVFVPPLLQRA